MQYLMKIRKCADHGHFELGRAALHCLAKPEVGRKAESFDVRCIAAIVIFSAADGTFAAQNAYLATYTLATVLLVASGMYIAARSLRTHFSRAMAPHSLFHLPDSSMCDSDCSIPRPPSSNARSLHLSADSSPLMFILCLFSP